MLTIEDLKHDKAEVERTIDKLLADFATKYDVRIESIDLEDIYTGPGRGDNFVRVYVSIKI